LLLMTNDGDLAQRVAHPSHGVEKEYLAEVEGRPSRGALRQLREGVELEDGWTAPAKVSEVKGTGGAGALRVTLHEGRNRQVRRMCEAVGHPVRRLVRVRIGPLRDQRLAPGEWRALATSEVRALERAAVPSPPAPSSVTKRSGRPDAAGGRGRSAKPPPSRSRAGRDEDSGRRQSGKPTKAGRPYRQGTKRNDPAATRGERSRSR
jgi:pseudouridine synthase